VRKRCAEASDDLGSDIEEGLSGDVLGNDPLEPPPKKNRKPRSSKKAAKPKGRPKAKATARVSCKAKEKKDKVKAERKRKEDINGDITGLPCMHHLG
jgi:hypothetical protein